MAAYTAAKEQGKVASLLDQERPNIFTQQIANIMPGQQIRITISYVETLKYEDGAYEWSFPMVVGPRYLPDTPSKDQEFHHAGHDISLELDLDAGVPIFEVSSLTHETEVQQLGERRAVVRLKDRATIPNKDFVLTYRVAGDSINDAVLAHRSERGGFPFFQVDLGLHRKFNFSETVGLQIQTDAFNVLNHTNFEDPLGNDLVTGGSLAFGQSTSVSGARTMRFSVKLLF